MISAIIAILGGLIGPCAFIISKKTNAQELLDKIVLYQGYIGVVLTLWGTWGLISAVINIDAIGLLWFVDLLVSLAEFAVGLILANDLLLKHFQEKDEMTMQIGQPLHAELTKYQVPAGLILISLGVFSLILRIIY